MAADNPREMLVLNRIPDVELNGRSRVAVSSIRQDRVDVVQERQELPALNGQVLLVDHVGVRSIGMVGSLANKSEWLGLDPKGLHTQREGDRTSQVEIDREVNVQVGIFGHDPGGAALWRDG